MDWFTVISLIVIGVALIIIEIIFVPGTTIVGVIGFIMAFVGLALSFRYFGSATGWTILGTSSVIAGGMFYWALTSKAWERFALKSAIRSKVNEGELEGLNVGEEGKTVSALRPRGKASLAGKLIEVTTLGDYVDSGTRVKIIRIIANQVTVEPIN